MTKSRPASCLCLKYQCSALKYSQTTVPRYKERPVVPVILFLKPITFLQTGRNSKKDLSSSASSIGCSSNSSINSVSSWHGASFQNRAYWYSSALFWIYPKTPCLRHNGCKTVWVYEELIVYSYTIRAAWADDGDRPLLLWRNWGTISFKARWPYDIIGDSAVFIVSTV
jgi:hypothetical protein